jgi:glycosyltransferase involved in cell wall biosynthesis
MYTLRLLAKIRPALVHANALVGPPLLFASSLLGIPFVRHAHLANFDDIAEEVIQADAVIAVSSFVGRALLHLGVNPDSLHVVLNGVDTDYFRPGSGDRGAARAALGFGPAAVVVLVVARFAPSKRHDLVVRAVAMAGSEVPDLHR